jgi:hypothetical protein
MKERNLIMDNKMRCETCGATNFEKIIFEKPKRIAYLSDMSILEQNTGDNREQENICIDCFKKEITEQSKSHKVRFEIIPK